VTSQISLRSSTLSLDPSKDDGHEFCDVLAVFEEHVFIFVDREKPLADLSRADNQEVLWERWKRGTVEEQIKTAHGAEKYIRSGRRLYLDAKREKLFPIPLDVDRLIIHKIVVAHGAAEACRSASKANASGSIAISYSADKRRTSAPFKICLDKNNPVHVFDSHTLPIILRELDTVKDFSDYLDAKLRAVAYLDALSYDGEEDLLAHYWLNINPTMRRHFIGTGSPGAKELRITPGLWQGFTKLPQYAATKEANQRSYFWDKLILGTSDIWLAGRCLVGTSDLLTQRSPIREMAKEPRFVRRTIVEHIFRAIQAFPCKPDETLRSASFIPSIYEGKAYIFLQFWMPPTVRPDEHLYRTKRQEALQIILGAAKNLRPEFHTLIGISIDPPNLTNATNSTGPDFLLMDCHEWSDGQRAKFEELNKIWSFFEAATPFSQTAWEFVLPET